MRGDTLNFEEYYLWSKNGGKIDPWKRQYLNEQFLEYEKKRINKLTKLQKEFRKVKSTTTLDGASFYTVPLVLFSSWKAAIAERGNYNYIGLNAILNSLHAQLIALFPNETKQPQEYRLIEITKSSRTMLFNKRLNIFDYAVIIEDWAYLPSDKIYVDVPYEKQNIHKIFKENLTDNDQLSLSFQSPIMSAPRVYGSIGGISLSSISDDLKFGRELVKAIQLIVPPEYRILNPPKKVYNGSKFEYLDGIKFHLAERPYCDKNVLSGICSREYNRLSKEQLKRYKFKGEFSIFSTISPDVGNETHVWKELLKEFTATEVTIPWNIYDLVEEDVYSKSLKSAVNEDLWIQVVHCHQYNPGIDTKADNDFIKTVDLLRKDYDVLLSDTHKDEQDREYIIGSMLGPSKDNLKRIAQSIARADEKDQLSSKYLKQARDLIIDNFKGFIEHPDFKDIKSVMEKRKVKTIAENRYSIVQTEIINNPRSSTSEIFESVKSTNLFRDIYDLQHFLDWLHDKGHVIVDRNKRYIWIGR